MENITANAHYNLKEVPQKLYINGTITTDRPDDKLSLKKAIPQGINGNILILELKIIEGIAPMKGTFKPFHKKLKKGNKMYDQVSIHYGNNESITINIEILG